MAIFRRRKQKGTVLLEFALGSVFLVPLIMGTFVIGTLFGRAIQTGQVCRDVGHMFQDNVDLSLTRNQKIVGRLAHGLGLASDTSGTIDPNGLGVVILSEIIHVGASECAAGGYSTTASCPNYDQLVFTKRIVIGKVSLRSSAFGTPSSSLLQADGSINASDYTKYASAKLTSTTAVDRLSLAQGQYTYATEAYFTTPNLKAFTPYMGSTAALAGTYSFNFF